MFGFLTPQRFAKSFDIENTKGSVYNGLPKTSKGIVAFEHLKSINTSEHSKDPINLSNHEKAQLI